MANLYTLCIHFVYTMYLYHIYMINMQNDLAKLQKSSEILIDMFDNKVNFTKVLEV